MDPNKVKNSTCTCSEEVNEEQLYTQLDSIIEAHRNKDGALIPVLQVV